MGSGEKGARGHGSFGTACQRAGIAGVSPHTLRHTCGTWMAQRGVALHMIGGWLGHTDTRTTELQKVSDSIKTSGTHELFKWEAKYFLGFSQRWRNIPKPSIAAVQGACIAGGLLLVWPCDIIIAADNARFSDPVVLMGIGGVEYHGHTWELGPTRFNYFFIDENCSYHLLALLDAARPGWGLAERFTWWAIPWVVASALPSLPTCPSYCFRST